MRRDLVALPGVPLVRHGILPPGVLLAGRLLCPNDHSGFRHGLGRGQDGEYHQQPDDPRRHLALEPGCPPPPFK